jgi:hypothetical protein
MRIISYSLFGDPTSFEFGFYLRGIYFNARMNRLLYPDWETWIYMSSKLIEKYYGLINDLGRIIPKLSVLEQDDNPPKCLGMLWRMMPIFEDGVTHVLCRDADSITTYREAQCVLTWETGNTVAMNITDNPSHSGMMGGMCGFNTAKFKQMTGYKTFEGMVKGLKLTEHGSDQNFLNSAVLPKIKNHVYDYYLDGHGCGGGYKMNHVPKVKIPNVSENLWESNLTIRHIGGAGCVDMELLRFFQRFDKDERFDNFEKSYPQIMYWRWN